jgi:hypothetical protein
VSAFPQSLWQPTPKDVVSDFAPLSVQRIFVASAATATV